MQRFYAARAEGYPLVKINTHRFKEIAKEELKNTYSRGFLDIFSQFFPILRKNAMESFSDPQEALEKSAAIRRDVVARLPQLLDAFENNAANNGAKVIRVKDGREANTVIVNLAKKRGIQYVTKGKSMVTEEIGLNQALQANGIDAFESDLGEFITQLLDRPPFHIVGPAMNVPVEEISDIFIQRAEMKTPTLDPVELGHAARVYLRNKFHHAGMGITGVNMAVADTGTIINVENEGNIRMSKSSPKTQVSVMTLEKVVPDMQDALHLLRVLCRSCTGQKLAAYVSMDSGPKKTNEIDGPEELFIIIVDNGRSELYKDIQSRQALQCIRCGACLNTCPVYTKIGGYPYGWAYSGPMGQVLTPLLLGLETTEDLFRACTRCGACREVCPAGIDHPKMFQAFETRRQERKKIPGLNREEMIIEMGFVIWGWLVTRPRLWELTARLTRKALSLPALSEPLKRIDGPVKHWTHSRTLPHPASQTFREHWKALKKAEYDR